MLSATDRQQALRRGWSLVGALLLLLVAIVSLTPSAGVAMPFVHADKLVHVAMYLALGGWLACLGLAALPLLVALFLYGVAMEIGQLVVPGRGLEILDMLANLLGAMLGLLAARHLWNPLEWLQARQ